MTADWYRQEEYAKKLINQGMILAFSYRDGLGKYHHPSEVEQACRIHFRGREIRL